MEEVASPPLVSQRPLVINIKDAEKPPLVEVEELDDEDLGKADQHKKFFKYPRYFMIIIADLNT